jgi:2-amino-4-hydroxy-6-hydroxymethyldihydropteridine diphosphokinase
MNMVESETILIGLGANLRSRRYGPPRQTLEAALGCLAAEGVSVRHRSRWYETAPVPISDQPWYVNGVAVVATTLEPLALLAVLHRIEAEIGRVRGDVNAARAIDLDLLAYGERVVPPPGRPLLPHPRLHERAFVLRPLAEVMPGWRHPVSGATIPEMLSGVDPAQVTRPIVEAH